MMKIGQTLVMAVLFVVAVSACASSGSGSQTSYNRISAEEIASMEGQVGNLYDLVSRLRPRWLQVRSTQRSLSGGDQEIVVYQDQSLLGGVDMLSGLGLELPLYLSYLDGAQATAQLSGLGSRRVEGAIIIHTR